MSLPPTLTFSTTCDAPTENSQEVVHADGVAEAMACFPVPEPGHLSPDSDATQFEMNSMVLTSGEVTGLSQDRVSKQDAVAGKHKKQVVDDKLIPQ